LNLESARSHFKRVSPCIRKLGVCLAPIVGRFSLNTGRFRCFGDNTRLRQPLQKALFSLRFFCGVIRVFGRFIATNPWPVCCLATYEGYLDHSATRPPGLSVISLRPVTCHYWTSTTLRRQPYVRLAAVVIVFLSTPSVR